MSLWNLPKTYGNLRRMRHIASVLARHGFSYVLQRLRLAEMAPWVARIIERFGRRDATGEWATLPERLTSVLQELGATYVKFGQILATRPDLIPPDFVHAFSKLHDDVDPLPAKEVRPVLEKALGGQLSDFFSSFAETPIAAGSIGQVHSAVLPNGDKVAVKVMRPGVDGEIREDLRLLALLAELAVKHWPEIRFLHPVEIVDEFARSMEDELDYVCEASHTEKFRRGLDPDGQVTAPMVHWNLTGKNVLVLEFIDGEPFTKSDQWDPGTKRAAAKAVGNCFMRQFFATGFFHADPHPGNIFLRPDGRIGLIDFGQTGHITEDMRRRLSLFLVALDDEDVDLMAELYAEIGVPSEDANLRGFKNDLRGLMDRYFSVPIDRMDMNRAMQDALSTARRNGLTLPRELALMVKSFAMVIGVVRGLDPNYRIDQEIKPFAKRMVLEISNPVGLLRRLGLFGQRFLRLFRRAPEDLRDLVEKARAGRLRIVFHHENLEPMTMRMEHAVNRLTLGIILAAITVGSSIVLSAGPGIFPQGSLPMLGNIPLSVVVAGAGFCLAMVIGLYVAWGVLRDKKP